MNIAAVNRTEEEQQIWELLNGVYDPEVPVLSINDLGIVRKITCIHPASSVEISVTPTYSGCPAMDVINMNIRLVLLQHGYTEVYIKTVLSPAWSTDWLTEKGKQKLKAYGIAPPASLRSDSSLFSEAVAVQCPLCNSYNTSVISEFGSTACKSLYRCNDCGEPFDHFKCH